MKHADNRTGHQFAVPPTKITCKEELEEMLEEAITELDAGKGVSGDVVFKDLSQRAAARRRARG